MNRIHAKAERIAQEFKALGYTVEPVTHSTNRNGDNSSYFWVVGLGEMRISDHFSAHVMGWDVSTYDTAAEIVAVGEESKRRAAAEKAARDQARDALEAPFKARFLAAREHEQHDILVECYPSASKDDRRAVRRRWMA